MKTNPMATRRTAMAVPPSWVILTVLTSVD